IIKCAMLRKESRGLHYNIEYPYRDDKLWGKDTIIRRAISDINLINILVAISMQGNY
ncbi:MAG: hypothetical protein KKC23_05405, partial [Proteobacteria bacterium]|nr:hypothetical protein [Pseudomonadota bacterium]